MPTPKKTDDTAEEAPAEEAAPADAKGEGPVCVNCGLPATVRTTSAAVDQVYYCDQHGQRSGEPVTPIGR